MLSSIVTREGAPMGRENVYHPPIIQIDEVHNLDISLD